MTLKAKAPCINLLGCNAPIHLSTCPGPLKQYTTPFDAEAPQLEIRETLPYWNGERGVWTVYTMGDHTEAVESMYTSPIKAIENAETIPAARIFFWRFGTTLRDGLKWWNDILQDIEKR